MQLTTKKGNFVASGLSEKVSQKPSGLFLLVKKYPGDLQKVSQKPQFGKFTCYYYYIRKANFLFMD